MESKPRRSRLAAVGFLVAGLGLAAYLGRMGPHEQHVRIVLGNGAPLVTAMGLQYLGPDGEVARETRLDYTAGGAPRIVAHDPELRNADYLVQIDLDTRDGRRTVQRQVTLGGGSTQIDVASVIVAPSSPTSSDPK